MKRRIITIIAIVLAVACLVGVLTACNSASKGVKFKKAKIAVDYTAPTLFTSSNASELTGLVGYSVANQEESLVLFRKYNDSQEAYTYTLYNVAENHFIANDSTDTFNLYDYGDNAFYTRSSFDKVSLKYTTTLFNSKGEEVKYVDASGAEQSTFVAEYIPEVDEVSLDVFYYNACYYRVDAYGSSVSLIKKASDMSSYEYDFDYSNDNYYYEFTNNGIFIFNKSLDLVTSYYYESNDGKYGPFVLESGDVVFQYRYQQPDTSKDYTYVSNGTKYLLKTFVLEAKDGDVSKKSVDFVISELNANDVNVKNGDVTISDSVENIATLYPIENERLMNTYGDRICVSLSNKLKINGRLDKMIDNQTPGSFISNVINDMLVFSTPTSNKLVSASGSVIGDISYNQDQYNNSYLIRNGKIYDFSLKVVYDYAAAGYEFYRMLNNKVIFSKTDENGTDYFLFDGTNFNRLTSFAANTKVEFEYKSRYIYALKSTNTMTYDVTYSYYNENGEMISNLSDKNLSNVASDTKAEYYLYSASIYNTTTHQNETHYYRIGK